MTAKPDVVDNISAALRASYPGAEIQIGPKGIAMVTPDRDRFQIEIQRTSRVQAVLNASRK